MAKQLVLQNRSLTETDLKFLEGATISLIVDHKPGIFFKKEIALIQIAKPENDVEPKSYTPIDYFVSTNVLAQKYEKLSPQFFLGYDPRVRNTLDPMGSCKQLFSH